MEKKYNFKVASNRSNSSSILDFKINRRYHQQNVEIVEEREMVSKTLPSILKENNFELSYFDGLVMDTQGSEFLILKGVEDGVKNFDFIKTEGAEFELYEDYPKFSEIQQYLNDFGFEISFRDVHYRHNQKPVLDAIFTREDE